MTVASSHTASVPHAVLPMSPLERWGVRVASLLVWALLVCTVVYWVLGSPARLSSSQAAVVVDAPQTDGAALARLLGGGAADAADGAPPQADAAVLHRVQLHGVVADMGGEGVAVLSVDAQPAKPVRVGQAVLDAWVLRSVDKRSVVLAASSGAGGREVTVEMMGGTPQDNDAAAQAALTLAEPTQQQAWMPDKGADNAQPPMLPPPDPEVIDAVKMETPSRMPD